MARTEMNKSILVVNSANPEVDRLAGELARRGKLRTLVRRYAYMGRAWERGLEKIPSVSRQYANTMGKRKLAPGLAKDNVIDAGVVCDFAAAAAIRGGSGPVRLATNKWLLEKRRRTIARRAASLAGEANAIAGNYGVSWRAFERVKRAGGCTVLNYPNAHHRFQSELLAEEALREPHFAGTFTRETLSLAGVFDQ